MQAFTLDRTDCQFVASIGFHLISERRGESVILAEIEPGTPAAEAADLHPALKPGLELRSVIAGSEVESSLASGAAATLYDISYRRPLELRFSGPRDASSPRHRVAESGCRVTSVRLEHNGTLVSYGLMSENDETVVNGSDVTIEDSNAIMDETHGLMVSNHMTTTHSWFRRPRVTTRLCVHPVKPSVAATLLLGGGPRTLLRYLQHGECLHLSELQSLTNVAAVLEFQKLCAPSRSSALP